LIESAPEEKEPLPSRIMRKIKRKRDQKNTKQTVNED